MSDQNVGLAIGITFAAGLATTVGAALSFCVKPSFTEILPISLSFSAGIMIYVSFVELLPVGLDAFEEDSSEFLSHLYLSLSFFSGIVIGYLLDFIVHFLGYAHDDDLTLQQKPQSVATQSNVSLITTRDNGNESAEDIELETSNNNDTDEEERKSDSIDPEKIDQLKDKQLIKTSLITALAIGLHNFPEGLATFVSTLADPTLGISIAIAIAIHNIPEGISVAMPIYFATGSKYKAFFWAFISGVFEPIGGLIGYAIIGSMFNDVVFGVLFGFTGGIMVYISFKELLPTARKKDINDKYATYLVFIGFLVMDISLILFKL